MIKFGEVLKDRMKAIYKISIFFCLFLAFQSSRGLAQTVAGTVIDTAAVPISNATVNLVAGTDTLRTQTDKNGRFTFKTVRSKSFFLSITNVGYDQHKGTYNIDPSEKQLQLTPITLKTAGNMLKEVTVFAKVNPVRVMKDTIEFNAAAYQVLQGDKVNDLLKQLPGIEVDGEDNVTTMGKNMTKLRVNGKDFFTNNVKDFINQLPASIVAKIQVIDDYGDQANFNGIKTGEPQKMLNIVTKADINSGMFGNIGVKTGTSNQNTLNGNANIWRPNEQIGTTLGISRLDNGAGQNKTNMVAINFRKTLKKEASIGFNYNFYNMDVDNQNTSFMETENILGTIYNDTENQGNNKTNNHNLNFDFQKNGKKDFISASANIAYSQSKSNNNTSSKQTGVIKQDLLDQRLSTSRAPNVNGNMSWSRKLAKKGSSLNANLSFSAALNKNDGNILSNTLYYDPITEVLAKDSLLNRLVNTLGNNNNIVGAFTYSYPLKKHKDTLTSSQLNASYNFSIGNSNNDVLTYVTDQANHIRYVDSLSTQYTSLFFTQQIGTSYSFNNKKINTTVGASVRPNLLLGDYENLDAKIRNTTVNYAPIFNLSYRLSTTKSISVRYNGNSNSPSANQLQPVRNTQNLQNVVIGNPDLKPSFNHSFNVSYNANDFKTGRSLQLALGGSTTQNQIVSNVILIRDTLNSLKQETRYENADGMYNLNGNYAYNIPLVKNKLTFSLRGNLSFANNVVFTDNVKLFNKSLNLSQSVSSTLNLKNVNLSTSASYGLNTNNFSLLNSPSRNIETWNFSLNARATVFKTFKLTTNLSKRINSGYALANRNPLLIGATINKTFLKSRALSVNVQAVDLLAQGNNLTRYVSANTTVDSRNNQITRYFTFGLSYNLQKFGGKGGRMTIYD